MKSKDEARQAYFESLSTYILFFFILPLIVHNLNVIFEIEWC